MTPSPTSPTDALMVSFFAANPNKSVRDFYQSLKPEDVGGEDAIRTLATCVHSKATRLWAQGYLTRVLRVDASGQEVWTYCVAPEGTTGTGGQHKGRGYKALLEAEREAWDTERTELKEGWDLSLLQRDRAREERDALKAKVAALEAEVASLTAILDSKTNPQAAGRLVGSTRASIETRDPRAGREHPDRRLPFRSGAFVLPALGKLPIWRHKKPCGWDKNPCS